MLLRQHVNAKSEEHVYLGVGDDVVVVLEPPAVAGVELLVVRLGFVGGPGGLAGVT